MSKSFLICKPKTDDDIKKSITRIIHQLEHGGRAVSNNGKASRVLSRFLREPVKNERIYFTWNQKHGKSIIVLPPNIRLIPVRNNRIKLVLEKDFGKKELLK